MPVNNMSAEFHSSVFNKLSFDVRSSYGFDSNRREVLLITSKAILRNENGEKTTAATLILSNQPNATGIVQSGDIHLLQNDEHATILTFADEASVNTIIEMLTSIRDNFSKFMDETHE